MKSFKFILIALLSFALTATVSSCKKEKSPQPAALVVTAPTPTVDVEFFVGADSYEVREPFDYPSGSPMFHNTFTSLGSNDPCTTTGSKITVKYSTTDTTNLDFYFFTSSTPVMFGSIKITPAGKISSITLNSPPAASTTPVPITCKNAVIFN